MKTYWLLLAISQDNPKNTHVISLLEICEQAALGGHWEVPFKHLRLPPMSPPLPKTVGNRFLPTPVGSLRTPSILRASLEDGSFNSVLPSPSDVERPSSPDGLAGGIYSSLFMDTGMEGLLIDQPPNTESSEMSSEFNVPSPIHVTPKRVPGLSIDDESTPANWNDSFPSGMSPPFSPSSSPRKRETTFGATLDFVEALCAASSGLTVFQPEERDWALRKALQSINAELERASKTGMAVWFPMGTHNQRVVRLAWRESVLLNSREKAPFTLMIEVLDEEGAAAAEAAADARQEELARLSSPNGPALNAAAIEAAAAGIDWVAQHHRSASQEIISNNLAQALHAVQGSTSSHVFRPPSAALSATETLSPDLSQSLSPPKFEEYPAKQLSAGPTPSTPERHQPLGGGTWIGGSRYASTSPLQPIKEPQVGIHRRSSAASPLDAALAGLRGEAPLVTVTLEVLNDVPVVNSGNNSEGEETGSNSSNESPVVVGLSKARRAAVYPEPKVSIVQCTRNSWACRFGFCKQCNASSPKQVLPLVNTDIVKFPKPARPPAQPSVKVTLKVTGGVDLAIRKTPLGAKHHRMPSTEAIARVARQHKIPVPPDTPIFEEKTLVKTDTAVRRSAAKSVYGEAWEARQERVRRSSLHGRRPGWALRSVIVKSGDDCRQELLAMQLISTLDEIFREAGLPLVLRPYEVLVTSNRTALIEMVPNAPSIHNIKSQSPPGTSLRSHLEDKFGGEGSPDFFKVQRIFTESLAAYSLVTYLLSLKDRHNGNILLDDTGRIVHIDFGFMFSNSPGGVNFESAPFKLTREMLEVMDSGPDGAPSQHFDYFKVLLIQGLLATRRHSDRLCLLVEMMANSGCPCFRNKNAAVSGLRKRLHLNVSESHVVEIAMGLIAESVDSWRTRQYDFYQRCVNGIMT